MIASFACVWSARDLSPLWFAAEPRWSINLRCNFQWVLARSCLRRASILITHCGNLFKRRPSQRRTHSEQAEGSGPA